MTVKLLAEHQFEFLSLNRGCTGSHESTLVKMLHGWKSHVTTQKLADCFSLFLLVVLIASICVFAKFANCTDAMTSDAPGNVNFNKCKHNEYLLSCQPRVTVT